MSTRYDICYSRISHSGIVAFLSNLSESSSTSAHSSLTYVDFFSFGCCCNPYMCGCGVCRVAYNSSLLLHSKCGISWYFVHNWNISHLLHVYVCLCLSSCVWISKCECAESSLTSWTQTSEKPLTNWKPKENELCILDSNVFVLVCLRMWMCLYCMNLNILSTSQNITPSRHGKNMKILLATPESIFKWNGNPRSDHCWFSFCSVRVVMIWIRCNFVFFLLLAQHLLFAWLEFVTGRKAKWATS